MKLANISILLSVLVSLFLVASADAQPASKEELQKRFEQRYPQILEHKTQGKIGETMQGLIEAVEAKFRQDDAALAKLIDEENADRKALYAIIAKETNTTPERVAERTAQRNFEKARKGEYLKSAQGKWERKE